MSISSPNTMLSASSPHPTLFSPSTMSALRRSPATPSSNNNSNLAGSAALGKDGDAVAVRREVQRMIGEVERLQIELEAIYADFEKTFLPSFNMSSFCHRTSCLMDGLSSLAHTLRVTGLGALPISGVTTNALEPHIYNLITFIETKQKEVQQLWKERQRNREGASIAASVLLAPTLSRTST